MSIRSATLGFLLTVTTLVLGACANNPLSVAETASQRGYAIESAYNIILEDALAVASAPQTTPEVRQRIQAAEASATPIIGSMSDTLAAFEVERAKFDAGQSTQEKVSVVAANLTSWIDRAKAALINLQTAFR